MKKDTTNIPPDSQQHVEMIGAQSKEETNSRKIQAI
jgi:hypothetical protein